MTARLPTASPRLETSPAALSRRALLLAVAAASLTACAGGRIRDRRAEQRAATAPQPPSNGAAAGRLPALAEPGPFAIGVREGDWTDAARGGRVVPWRIYAPQGVSGLAPVVIFSHGGGGTVAAAEQWGRHIATHGVASLHPQHAGSDRDAFRTAPRQIAQGAADPRLAAPRFEDIQFTVAQMKAGRAGAGLDMARLGMAGHSFGAITTLIAVGQIVTGFGQSFAVPDIKAAVALSPSPPRAAYGETATAFIDMKAPIFHMTGSEDDAPTGEFEAPVRREPFDAISNVDQRLLWLDGANHFTFGGAEDPQLRGQSFAYPDLPRHHAILRAAMAAWWLDQLTGDAAARAFLDTELRSFLGPRDTIEAKAA